MAKADKDKNGFDRIPFRMHPRVFAALGADLVTNDVVAVIELVKNSYDAFANNVWLRFRQEPHEELFLEIEDDGTGMTREIIEDVWCVVATPYKVNNPEAKSGKKVRRVAGEKGLGRLSVSRLGDRLHMLTQAPGCPCWELTVNWSEVAMGEDLSESFVQCRKYPEPSPFQDSGTRLRVHGLKGYWDESQAKDLEDNLARLISPFSDLDDFNVFLTTSDKEETDEVGIDAPVFLSKPKYSIKGEVSDKGDVKAEYRFAPIAEGTPRRKRVNISWEQIFDGTRDRERFPFDPNGTHCGPFSFEIRAWDIGSEDTKEIADKFDFQKSMIRKAIGVHKGLSVYRDGILVLPKSENSRDWLGLDLRRVSKVGTRMSTSQLVGYVAITAESNPRILDTSDRERLVSCLDLAEFEEILKAVLGKLENERDEDRTKQEREEPMKDLFDELSAEDLIAEVIALADEGAEAAEAIPVLQAFSASLDAASETIQERFIHYSRMATVGTIAQMLIHEIRNRTTAFGSFLDFIKSRFGPFKDQDMVQQYRYADNSVNALERLADTFSPLASRSFSRRKRKSVLEEQINECIALLSAEIKRKNVKYHVPDTATTLAVDPGELDAVILNVLTNALYWLGEVPKDSRDIQFRFNKIINDTRLRIWVHDSGPGIEDDVVEKIFLPGVTKKPSGIGMGLTVASEIVAEYGGRMIAKHPGTLGGASFAFDLPLKKLKHGS